MSMLAQSFLPMPSPWVVTPQPTARTYAPAPNPSTPLAQEGIEPLPFEDDEINSSDTEEGDDDFIDIFHSIPLPKLTASLRSIKRGESAKKGTVF